MLTLDNVSRNFGGLQALFHVSFEVPEGLITSLIGPNGAGKTVLFNCLNGILSPDEGKVMFKGTDITGWPPHRVCKAGIGRTFQDVRLFFNMNVLENVMAARFCRTRSTLLDSVAFLPRWRAERKHNQKLAEELLEEVGMHEFRHRMPRELSYGYQRRLEIARALAAEPNMLVLDEPLAGVSYRAAQQMVDLIVRLKEEGLTIFLIEHNMNLVLSISDKVVALNFGHKIAEGTPAEVRADTNVINAYLGVET